MVLQLIDNILIVVCHIIVVYIVASVVITVLNNHFGLNRISLVK